MNLRRRPRSAIRPGGDADTVAGEVGEDPGGRGAGIVDDAAAGCQSRCQALLGLFAADGYVDVHGVTEGPGRVEALHPDRRSVAKGVNDQRAAQSGDLRHRLSQPGRLSQRRHAEDCHRAAMKHHPVGDTLCGEEPPPSLLAHGHLRSRNRSQACTLAVDKITRADRRLGSGATLRRDRV
jgi:hypothetical protein